MYANIRSLVMKKNLVLLYLKRVSTRVTYVRIISLRPTPLFSYTL